MTGPAPTAAQTAPTASQTARSAPRASARRIALAAVLDIVLVLAFVLIGRSSHAEAFSPTGILTTWWPFLVGLALGWVVARAWRNPFGVKLPGISIWLLTVLVGMLLRTVSGQGVEVSFVIVTTIVLAVFLLGWRAVAHLVSGRHARARAKA